MVPPGLNCGGHGAVRRGLRGAENASDITAMFRLAGWESILIDYNALLVKCPVVNPINIARQSRSITYQMMSDTRVLVWSEIYRYVHCSGCLTIFLFERDGV